MFSALALTGSLPTKYRCLRNPQGLNEILSEILSRSVDGDWDKNLPLECYIGKRKKEQLRGTTSQVFGDMMERHAFLYLKEELQNTGWKLVHRARIGRHCYDCVGWENKDYTDSPDLAIEMYFSIPKKGKYELEHVRRKTAGMVARLEKIDAGIRYIVIGVPRDSEIEVIERQHPDIKVVYQEHKIKRFQVKKRTIPNPTH